MIKKIGRALAAIHRQPDKDWTVELLASEVGMSRSGFSARFTDRVGESTKRYLTRWRMQLARVQLRETSDSLAVLADRLGYQSEAAFCRTFKRVFGEPPGSFRQSSIASKLYRSRFSSNGWDVARLSFLQLLSAR